MAKNSYLSTLKVFRRDTMVSLHEPDDEPGWVEIDWKNPGAEVELILWPSEAEAEAFVTGIDSVRPRTAATAMRRFGATLHVVAVLHLLPEAPGITVKASVRHTASA
ncbi:MAG: hypothetical protein IPK78_03950 [Rhodospirillales bacterium]|nr:hypothetical protein [Rhodospirillales bacterium]